MVQWRGLLIITHGCWMSADIRKDLCNQTSDLIWSDGFWFLRFSLVWFAPSDIDPTLQTAAFPLCEWQGIMGEGLLHACKANSASLRVKSKPSIWCHGRSQRRPRGLLMSHIRSYGSWEERPLSHVSLFVFVLWRGVFDGVGAGVRRCGGHWHDLWLHFRNSSPTNPQIRKLPAGLQFILFPVMSHSFTGIKTRNKRWKNPKCLLLPTQTAGEWLSSREEGCCVKPLDRRQCFFLLTADLTHCFPALLQHCEISPG